MSQRLGMADGRCFTINTANRLLNDYIMDNRKIRYEDNYEYRKLLQRAGPDVIKFIENKQTVGKQPSSNFVNQCMSCNTPLLKVPRTY